MNIPVETIRKSQAACFVRAGSLAFNYWFLTIIYPLKLMYTQSIQFH